MGTILGGALGAAGGSALGCKLQKDDRAKAEQAMQTALATGENQSWQSAESGAVGRVDVLADEQGQSLAGLRFAQGVEPWSGYSKIGAAYVTKMPANVRSRPGTDGRIVGQLATGTRIWVPASADGAPWFLIADKGLAQGYVSNALLEPVPVSQSPCRMVKQSVSLPNGGSESETYQACPDADGQWVLTRV